MSARIDIEFSLNGQTRRCAVPPAMSALEMLRDVIGLTGTKYGCGEGECGACTINVDGRTLNSCLMFAVDCDGRAVRTIEGLAATPIGERLVHSLTEHGAVQCGFCTPGMVMQAEQILSQNARLGEQQIRRGLEGNLCRCTGYRKIIDAIEALAAPAGVAR
ncbi:MAG: (2Fe-2S)-binding protein [Gammaproteobacteria bacterium]|nr:(2Fe-2S)-binding protein [Gammaproteobacteria bacterium]